MSYHGIGSLGFWPFQPDDVTCKTGDVWSTLSQECTASAGTALLCDEGKIWSDEYGGCLTPDAFMEYSKMSGAYGDWKSGVPAKEFARQHGGQMPYLCQLVNQMLAGAPALVVLSDFFGWFQICCAAFYAANGGSSGTGVPVNVQPQPDSPVNIIAPSTTAEKTQVTTDKATREYVAPAQKSKSWIYFGLLAATVGVVVYLSKD